MCESRLEMCDLRFSEGEEEDDKRQRAREPLDSIAELQRGGFCSDIASVKKWALGLLLEWTIFFLLFHLAIFYRIFVHSI